MIHERGIRKYAQDTGDVVYSRLIAWAIYFKVFEALDRMRFYYDSKTPHIALSYCGVEDTDSLEVPFNAFATTPISRVSIGHVEHYVELWQKMSKGQPVISETFLPFDFTSSMRQIPLNLLVRSYPEYWWVQSGICTIHSTWEDQLATHSKKTRYQLKDNLPRIRSCELKQTLAFDDVDKIVKAMGDRWPPEDLQYNLCQFAYQMASPETLLFTVEIVTDLGVDTAYGTFRRHNDTLIFQTFAAPRRPNIGRCFLTAVLYKLIHEPIQGIRYLDPGVCCDGIEDETGVYKGIVVNTESHLPVLHLFKNYAQVVEHYEEAPYYLADQRKWILTDDSE